MNLAVLPQAGRLRQRGALYRQDFYLNNSQVIKHLEVNQHITVYELYNSHRTLAVEREIKV